MPVKLRRTRKTKQEHSDNPNRTETKTIRKTSFKIIEATMTIGEKIALEEIDPRHRFSNTMTEISLTAQINQESEIPTTKQLEDFWQFVRAEFREQQEQQIREVLAKLDQ